MTSKTANTLHTTAIASGGTELRTEIGSPIVGGTASQKLWAAGPGNCSLRTKREEPLSFNWTHNTSFLCYAHRLPQLCHPRSADAADCKTRAARRQIDRSNTFLTFGDAKGEVGSAGDRVGCLIGERVELEQHFRCESVGLTIEQAAYFGGQLLLTVFDDTVGVQVRGQPSMGCLVERKKRLLDRVEATVDVGDAGNSVEDAQHFGKGPLQGSSPRISNSIGTRSNWRAC